MGKVNCLNCKYYYIGFCTYLNEKYGMKYKPKHLYNTRVDCNRYAEVEDGK